MQFTLQSSYQIIVWDIACHSILTRLSLFPFPTSPTLSSVSLGSIPLENHLHTNPNFRNGFKPKIYQKPFSSPKDSFTSTSSSVGPPLNLIPQPSNLVIMLDFFFSPPYTIYQSLPGSTFKIHSDTGHFTGPSLLLS